MNFSWIHSGPGRRCGGIAAAAVVWFCGAGPGARAAEPTVWEEYAVKAACLFNFAKFVEWPSGAFAREDSPIVIGILGDNPFGASLREIVAGQTVGKRPLEIRQSSNAEDLRNCQMLFISRSEKERIRQHLAVFADTPALTVGEFDGFATRHGGVINLYVPEEKRLRFRVNVDALKRKGLKMSPQMMNFAIVVHDEPGTPEARP